MKEYKLTINGNEYTVSISKIEDSLADVEVNGIPFKVEIERAAKKQSVPLSKINKPAQIDTTVVKPASSGTETVITSPLPGVILDISVKEGDIVKRGQTLLVLEAMKMENSIEATADGKIISIKAQKGDSVLEGAVLVIIG